MKPLPVLETVARSVMTAFRDLKGVATVAGPWIAIVSVLLLIAATSWIPSMLATVLIAGALLLNWLGILAVIVAWHRHVIRDERFVRPMAPLRLRVLLYAVQGFIVSLPGCLAAIPATVVSMALFVVLASVKEGGYPNWLINVMTPLLFLPIMVLYAVVTARFLLVLPGTAIDDGAMTLGRSWQLTRGNAWRLIAAGLLLGLIFAIAFAILAAVASAAGIAAAAVDTGPMAWRFSYGDEAASSGAQLTAGGAVINLVSLVLNYLGAVLFATFLSLAYLRLAPGGADTTQ